MSCPHGQEDAKLEGYRPKKVQSLFGSVTDERAYYYCSACGQDWFPTDEETGLTDRETPAARKVITLVSVLEPFEEVTNQVLSQSTRINVSASTAQRQTESLGTDVAECRVRGKADRPHYTAGLTSRRMRSSSVLCQSGCNGGVPQ